jgi:hypothetical protein
MKPLVYRRSTRIEAPAAEVFRWHERPEALAELIPPWERTEVLSRSGEGVADGVRVVLRVRVGPFSRRWIAEHCGRVEGREFRDRMVKGPFRRWEHTHRFEPLPPAACLLTDEIEYVPPLGRLGAILLGRFVRRKLDRLFAWRHERTRAAFA